MDTATALPTVFISYSHQDEAWKDRLVKQLQVLELEGDLEVWEDRQIDAGDDWLPEIEEAMARARVAVLLVSADFLISKFISVNEVPEILRRREEEGLRVIPVIVRPCPWQGVQWLSKIQSRPKDGRPLSAGTEHQIETDLAALALEIRDLLASSPPSLLQGSTVRGSQGFEPLAGAPPLHNLPYPPLGDLFTGRQDELDALATTGTAAITQSATISGLGGIGKTRLAVEYAWRSGNRYNAAWFVRADSPENLRRNLAALAGPELMNLPEWEAQKEDQTVAAVKRSLREYPGWLMILDNVDTPEAADAVLEALPSLSNGRVLITSRLTTWPASVRKRSLDKLSPEEAVRFLLHRTDEGRDKATDDPARAADLAERVDGLPLALEQAAAFINRHRMRLAGYLRSWEQERTKLLSWYDKRVMQYPASVAVTWKQTFDRLSPTPAALLRLMAFLAPDPIPFDMLEQGAEHVKEAAEFFCEETGRAADEKTVREATADLADYSLITWQDGGTLAVHRMVQEALRSQISDKHRKDWIEKTIRIVNDSAVVNPRDVRTWPVWGWLRPHVAGVVARADEVGIVMPTSQLMNTLGSLLQEKALYSEAEPLLRRSLAIDEAFFGNEHPEVAAGLNNLAALLIEMNRLGEAEPLIRQALAIMEAFEPKDPNVAFILNNLAQLLQGTDRLEEAESLMWRALAIDETSFGKAHPNVARDLNNLAGLFRLTLRMEEAESLMRRVLAIDEASFGSTHPEVALDLHNLAWVLQGTNRLV